jgi:hypothetical protein
VQWWWIGVQWWWIDGVKEALVGAWEGGPVTALNVHWMLTECSLNVHWIFTDCSLNVHLRSNS